VDSGHHTTFEQAYTPTDQTTLTDSGMAGYELTQPTQPTQHQQTSAHHLEIDSKLLRIYAGKRPISILKQHKNTCRSSRNSRRTPILRTKVADRRHETLMVCYGKWSDLKQSSKRSGVTNISTMRKGAYA
jgi:hypothetical protein